MPVLESWDLPTLSPFSCLSKTGKRSQKRKSMLTIRQYFLGPACRPWDSFFLDSCVSCIMFQLVAISACFLKTEQLTKFSVIFLWIYSTYCSPKYIGFHEIFHQFLIFFRCSLKSKPNSLNLLLLQDLQAQVEIFGQTSNALCLNHYPPASLLFALPWWKTSFYAWSPFTWFSLMLGILT